MREAWKVLFLSGDPHPRLTDERLAAMNNFAFSTYAENVR